MRPIKRREFYLVDPGASIPRVCTLVLMPESEGKWVFSQLDWQHPPRLCTQAEADVLVRSYLHFFGRLLEIRRK